MVAMLAGCLCHAVTGTTDVTRNTAAHAQIYVVARCLLLQTRSPFGGVHRYDEFASVHVVVVMGGYYLAGGLCVLGLVLLIDTCLLAHVGRIMILFESAMKHDGLFRTFFRIRAGVLMRRFVEGITIMYYERNTICMIIRDF
jgi:hypothetical protein